MAHNWGWTPDVVLSLPTWKRNMLINKLQETLRAEQARSKRAGKGKGRR